MAQDLLHPLVVALDVGLFEFLHEHTKVYLMCTCSTAFVTIFKLILDTKDWEDYGTHMLFRNLSSSINILCKYAPLRVLAQVHIPIYELNKYLLMATWEGDLQTAQNMLFLGAKISAKMCMRAFPISQLPYSNGAVVTIEHVADVLEEWLKKGESKSAIFDVTWNYLDELSGYQALNIAVQKRHTSLVVFFLTIGAPLARDQKNIHPIDYAARDNNREILEILIGRQHHHDVLQPYTVEQLAAFVLHLGPKAATHSVSTVHSLCLDLSLFLPSDKSATPTVDTVATFPCTPPISLSFKQAIEVFGDSTDRPASNIKLTPLHCVILYEFDKPDTKTDELQLGTAQQEALRTDCVRYLLSNKPKLENCTNKGETALHFAAKYNREEILKLLLAHGALVNAVQTDGCTPLHVAASAGHANITKLLIEAGADITKTTTHRTTAMDFASLSGGIAVMQVLKASGATYEPHLLSNASKFEDLEPLKFLLSQNIPTTPGQYLSALHMAVGRGKQEAAALLIDAGADVNGRRNSKTPLQHAVASTQVKMLQFLVSKGGFLEWKNGLGETPLHAAVLLNYPEAVLWLVENGADIEAAIVKGHTPLLLATEANQLPTVKILIANGAKIDKRGKHGKPPLGVAVEGTMLECAKLLILAGADVKYTEDKTNKTLLHLCAKQGGVEMTKMLLEQGLDINALDAAGNTPLHYAIINDCAELATFLIDNGATVEVKNSEGFTAFQYINTLSCAQIGQKMLANGAVAHLNAASNDRISVVASLVLGDVGGLREALKQEAKVVEWHFLHAFAIKNYTMLHLMLEFDPSHIRFCLQEAVRQRVLGLVKEILPFAQLKPDEMLELLHINLSFNDKDAIPVTEFLVANGADLNMQHEKTGETALHVATKVDNEEVLRWLLNNGANPYIRDFRGKFPLQKQEEGTKTPAIPFSKTCLALGDL